MQEIKARGCYDETNDKRKKSMIQDRRKKELARLKEESRQIRQIIKSGMDPLREIGIDIEVITDLPPGGRDSSMKRQASLMKKHDHWFDITDSESDEHIPCKE